MAFVLSGISAFISLKLIGLADLMKEFYTGQHLNSPFMNDYMAISTGYNAFIMLALVPVFALTTWIAFHQWKTNYYEHIVINAYILSTFTLANIVFIYPILFFLRHDLQAFTTVSSLIFLITPFILLWFFRGYYPEKPLKKIILKVLAVLGLTVAAFGILMVILMIVVAVYVITQGPEGAKYFLPGKV
jgi:hypothetical protein